MVFKRCAQHQLFAYRLPVIFHGTVRPTYGYTPLLYDVLPFQGTSSAGNSYLDFFLVLQKHLAQYPFSFFNLIRFSDI